MHAAPSIALCAAALLCVSAGGPRAARAQAPSPPAPGLAPVIVTDRSEGLDARAESASRLGLTVRETPASIDVLTAGAMRELGLRSVTEAAAGATGVTGADFPAEPANFSMRGFANSQLNSLYNGIRIGPPNMTSRVMDVGALERIEFLKGSASLMSGEGAAGGAINFVTKRPHRGPIRNELDLSAGSFGTVRTGFGSGGTTAIDSVDYRIDLNRTSTDGFVDDTGALGWHLSGAIDWYARPGLKLWGAVERKRDRASPYWGTPLVSAGAPGIEPAAGLVSGTYVSGFSGADLGPVAIDRRTLRTNYNVLDNRNTADETWLRGGFEARLGQQWALRGQLYRYAAEREWRNNEVIAFDPASGRVDRERFYVAHDQTLLGGKLDLAHEGRLAGRPNQLVAALEWSDLDFVRPGAANFPSDRVDLVAPDRGVYGPLTTQLQTSRIRTVAAIVEDRWRVTPTVALLAGLRTESIDLDRTSTNAAGASRPGFPFSVRWTPTTGRAGVTWDVLPGLTAYGQYATGVDVAANNLFLLRADQPPELARTRTLEVGLKGRAGAAGEWTVAAYDIERSNVFSAQGGRALVDAGRLASRGVEAAVSLRPSTAWRLWGNVAVNRATYRDYDFAGGSFSGNAPPNAPRVVANAGASYRVDVGRPVEVSAWVRHVGERFHSDANTVRLAAYTLVEASVSVELRRGTTLLLRGRNLTDRVYAAWADPFYPDQILIGPPRSVEIALRHAF
ncbi:MAG: TonB-dependent receptor [Burkholderiaceae bacterium]|jgi:iron complex outermembrane receptor protein|nr:TonB-dependent receptor [Burkholderiales bacterium]MCZ8102357.1 TonB-dependent receptor [Burkholderiales bacterium]MCZ8338191.1 TonB-dependent receptor [Burkholderiaceae bacterium]